jgi:hypothetical protein
MVKSVEVVAFHLAKLKKVEACYLNTILKVKKHTFQCGDEM